MSEPKHPRSRTHHVSYGKVIPAGRATRVTVSPRRALRVSVPRVGTLRIPRGAVARRTTLTLRPSRAELTGGMQAAGLGLDVDLHGVRLRRPLTWTQEVGVQPDGSVAVFAHRADDGSWGLQHATVSHGRMILRTAQWSFQVPSWLNPTAWAQWLGQRLTATLAGTTAPWTCPSTPNWMAVVNYATTVHACAQRNDAGAVERGEVRIENNRGYFQQVTMPAALARDYVWVNDQTNGVRSLLSAATHTDQGIVVFLPPGDHGLMTVGYRRPGAPGAQLNGTIRVQTTYASIAMDVIYSIVDAVAGELADDVKSGATAYTVGKCLGILDLGDGALHSPWEAASGASFGSMFSCMATEVGAALKDPDIARAAARSLNDPAYSKVVEGDYANQLASLGRKLHALGAILWARPLLQQGWVGAYDQLVNIWQRGRLSDIDVALAGRRATPVIPPRPGANPIGGPGPGLGPGPNPAPTGSVTASNNNGQMAVQVADFPTGTTYYFCHAGTPSQYPLGGTVTWHGQITVTSRSQSWPSGLCSGGHSTNMWVGLQGTDGHDYYSNQVVMDVAPAPGAALTISNNNGQMAVQVVNFPTGTTYYFCHAGSPADYPTGGGITAHGQVTITSPNQSWASGLCSGGHSTNMWVGLQGTDGHDYYSNQVVMDVAPAPGAAATVFGSGGEMSLQLSSFPTGVTYYFCHQGAPSEYPTGGAIIGHGQLNAGAPDGTYGPLCSGSGNAWIGVQGADGHDYYTNQITL